ncbi:hypothetical protein NUSPORA_00449 [Nucleospora cyclopteri]
MITKLILLKFVSTAYNDISNLSPLFIENTDYNYLNEKINQLNNKKLVHLFPMALDSSFFCESQNFKIKDSLNASNTTFLSKNCHDTIPKTAKFLNYNDKHNSIQTEDDLSNYKIDPNNENGFHTNKINLDQEIKYFDKYLDMYIKLNENNQDKDLNNIKYSKFFYKDQIIKKQFFANKSNNFHENNSKIERDFTKNNIMKNQEIFIRKTKKQQKIVSIKKKCITLSIQQLHLINKPLLKKNEIKYLSNIINSLLIRQLNLHQRFKRKNTPKMLINRKYGIETFSNYSLKQINNQGQVLDYPNHHPFLFNLKNTESEFFGLSTNKILSTVSTSRAFENNYSNSYFYDQFFPILESNKILNETSQICCLNNQSINNNSSNFNDHITLNYMQQTDAQVKIKCIDKKTRLNINYANTTQDIHMSFNNTEHCRDDKKEAEIEISQKNNHFTEKQNYIASSNNILNESEKPKNYSLLTQQMSTKNYNIKKIVNIDHTYALNTKKILGKQNHDKKFKNNPYCPYKDIDYVNLNSLYLCCGTLKKGETTENDTVDSVDDDYKIEESFESKPEDVFKKELYQTRKFIPVHKSASSVKIFYSTIDFLFEHWMQLKDSKNEIRDFPKGFSFSPGWRKSRLYMKIMHKNRVKHPFALHICKQYKLDYYFSLIFNMIRINTYSIKNRYVSFEICFHLCCYHFCTKWNLGKGTNCKINTSFPYHQYITNRNFKKLYKTKKYWFKKAKFLFKKAKKRALLEFGITKSSFKANYLYNFLLLLPFQNSNSVAFVCYVYHATIISEVDINFSLLSKDQIDLTIIKRKKIDKINKRYTQYMNNAKQILIQRSKLKKIDD